MYTPRIFNSYLGLNLPCFNVFEGNQNVDCNKLAKLINKHNLEGFFAALE
ncbi:hypothetical protein DET49_107118 [Salegentibacter sp. 24]|nr:hypothetical protein DET49_107118 [Salegentibacter sp. 24]